MEPVAKASDVLMEDLLKEYQPATKGKIMGKVIIHATMSLDGFIAGPHDEMDWVFKYDDDGMANEVMEETEAVSTTGMTSLRFRVMKS